MNTELNDPSTLEGDERRKFVIRCYVRGDSHQDIADSLGVSRVRVTQIIGTIRDNWKREYIQDFNVMVNRELERIDVLEMEAWDAWRKSKKPVKVWKTRKGEDRGQTTDITELEYNKDTETGDYVQQGNHYFLKQIESCIGMRMKILGLSSVDRRAQEAQSQRQIMIADIVKSLKDGSMQPDIVHEFFEAETVKEVLKQAGMS